MPHNQQTRPTGRELDSAVAKAMGYECVCDESRNACSIHSTFESILHPYSSDFESARAIERHIEKLELQDQYGHALLKFALPYTPVPHPGLLFWHAAWATLEQRCWTFLEVVNNAT